MNRTLVRAKDSICSNRAHVWAYDFKKQDVDSAKIFLFFTRKTNNFEGESWWYHVSPVINENGKLYVMDAGFPSRIKGPLVVRDWLREFNGVNSICKKIKAQDEGLIKLMLNEKSFPETTEAGTFSCYYRITSPGYWVPSQIARNLLNEGESRDAFEKSEVLQACKEATTSPLGWIMRRGSSRCYDFVYGNHILTSEY